MPVDRHGCTHDHGNFRAFFLNSSQNERGVLCAARFHYIFFQEIITSIIAIAGGIAMACKTIAELWKKVRFRLFLVDCCVSLHATCHKRVQMLKSKPHVVPIQHNVKVVVAGAQMTTDSVAKEE